MTQKNSKKAGVLCHSLQLRVFIQSRMDLVHTVC